MDDEKIVDDLTDDLDFETAEEHLKYRDSVRYYLHRVRQDEREKAIKYAMGCVRGGADYSMTVIKRRIGAYLQNLT